MGHSSAPLTGEKTCDDADVTTRSVIPQRWLLKQTDKSVKGIFKAKAKEVNQLSIQYMTFKSFLNLEDVLLFITKATNSFHWNLERRRPALRTARCAIPAA